MHTIATYMLYSYTKGVALHTHIQPCAHTAVVNTTFEWGATHMGNTCNAKILMAKHLAMRAPINLKGS